MSKKPKDTDEDYVDPDLAAQAEVQKKFEAEALAGTPPAAEAYAEEEMPQRFSTGGATFEEKQAWIEAHGGPPAVEGVVAPGDAEPKAKEDVAPE
jgi:hypothetical protein